MTEHWLIIAALAIGTFGIRLGGYLIGARIPSSGTGARLLTALPGCLIVALLAVILIQAGAIERLAAAVALGVALATRSLFLTMLLGMGTVMLLNSLG